MKISEQPTNHILVKAYTESEWDSCDFAIVSCGEGWAELLKKRLDACRHLSDDEYYFSSEYFDWSASFHVSSDCEADEVLPVGKDWAFVEMDKGEMDKFSVPENRLDCHNMLLYKGGNGRYQAYGKHTSEEFYTADLPFEEIVASLQ